MSAANPGLPQWHYLYGKPEITATIRGTPEDFIVDEQLNFTPSGSGEHVLLQIEKRGQNTQYIARQLARLTGLRMRDISYAGLKDRHALTRQWFCFKWPIKQELGWQQWQIEDSRILQVVRHYRKLRLGALKANHFQLTLTDVSEPKELIKRLQLIQNGVPNYYGEQRFGRAGANLALADSLFAGEKIADRQIRGLALSASRSYLFNTVLSERIARGLFNQVLDGDILQLDGSGSIFQVETADSTLQQRLLAGDVHPTAPLVGIEGAQVSLQAAALEHQALLPHRQWCEGLNEYRLQGARRSIRLQPQQLNAVTTANRVTLSFALPAGCFATSVLRELACYRDGSRPLSELE
ncbi:tRNA pseudouridine(13) synthase TruD [Arsukibacterium indicum]|uniref:tRNA pseudouridine synthase D n=1 Tax=Arsukibacterium indicum TaxID=2848612 RepID=A0ABS6MHT5_9GAMM|nr:tRNA pseudouridine(13) synthase TruD [Arsukibacterium indicum]MBV2128335.1 tRNA pseudouridine(13) synthase TruD [Arsukibacterium indicum]